MISLMVEAVPALVPSNLRQLIRDPVPSLASVVACSHFLTESRAGNPDLLTFLFSSETLTLILDTLFEDPSCPQRTYNSLVDFLTSESPPIQLSLLQSDVLAEYLEHFMSESHPNHRNLKMCGVAARIVFTLFKTSSGCYSSRLPGLLDFLLRNLAILAYRNLLADLIVLYPTLFPLTLDCLIRLLSDESAIFYVLSILKAILKKERALFPTGLSAVIRRLFEIAALPDRPPFVSLQALELIGKLRGEPEVDAILSEFASAFGLVINTKDCRLAVLLSLFPNRLLLHFDHFLAHETPTAYNAAAVAAVRSITNTEFITLVERPGFVAAISQSFKRSVVNGHICSFILALNDRRDLSNSLLTAAWSEFMAVEVFPHLERAARSYGGPFVDHRRVSPLESEHSTQEESSSSGSASDEDSPALRSPAGRRRNSAALTSERQPEFNIVCCEQVATLSDRINRCSVPSLGITQRLADRRTLRRHAELLRPCEIPILSI
jgi:hypothetical protein